MKPVKPNCKIKGGRRTNISLTTNKQPQKHSIEHDVTKAVAFFPKIMTRCAQRVDAPTFNKSKTFKSGIYHGLRVIKKFGAQTPPGMGLGLTFEWKRLKSKVKS